MVDRMVPTSQTICSRPIPFNQPPAEKLTIGRAKNNYVCLDAKIISNFHCAIWIDLHGDVWLKDMSSNGTYVRESKVGNGILTIVKHGDIKLGSHSEGYGFRWQDPNEPLPQDPLAFCGAMWRKHDFIKALGMDSFVKVHRVIERGTSNVRAVKHFKKSRLKSETSKGMFEKEMAILDEINHPNVVKLIECFDDDNDLCLVLEYVNGGDLLSYVSKRGGLLEEDARQIAKMLFPAIATFHSKKIVHRDLKPGRFSLLESELRTTWLAPEAIAKEFGQYTDKCDAWALGLVIFSCMINVIPFDRENSKVPLATRLERRVLKWKDLSEGTSPECCNFLHRLCRQRVEERMSVTEACQHPWILEDANLRVLKTVRLNVIHYLRSAGFWLGSLGVSEVGHRSVCATHGRTRKGGSESLTGF
ncbi:kinase-like protein [Atractiella rhizophila]|nr:kinase-like protein [Atractiella rhizophila]